MASAWNAMTVVAALGGVAVGAWTTGTALRTQPAAPVVVRVPDAKASVDAVTALGRLEPKDGVIRVAGPSKPAVVVAELLVDEGDAVEVGQTIVVLDSHATQQAEVARLRAELENTLIEQRRSESLYRGHIVAASERDAWRTKANVARAGLEQAEAELALTVVRAPISGRVLEIYARRGERVAADGILELGNTDEMFAVAEVYETDIARVRIGQHATITSPALLQPLEGTVEKIHLKIAKQDVLATDPAARTDARVVEVEIRLADSARAAGFTNLQVEVAIAPE